MNIPFSEAIEISVFDMCIVFLTLLLVSYIISLGAMLIAALTRKKQKKHSKCVPAPSITSTVDTTTDLLNVSDDQVIKAVIATAILGYMDGHNYCLEVRPIVRTTGGESAWINAARLETMH